MQEGYTPDLKIAEAVKKLPRYLQPMVTLMAIMVPPTKESKLWEKGGSKSAGLGHQHGAYGEYSCSFGFAPIDYRSPF